MRKSDKIIISVVLLSAIAQTDAHAQSTHPSKSSPVSSQPLLADATDSSSHHSYGGSHGSWFSRAFSRTSPRPQRSAGPRAGGFGSTGRPFTSSGS